MFTIAIVNTYKTQFSGWIKDRISIFFSDTEGVPAVNVKGEEERNEEEDEITENGEIAFEHEHEQQENAQKG